MTLTWMHLGGLLGVTALLTFIFFARHASRCVSALAVGIANMAVVLLHTVAPVRGLLDPAYRGYSFGLVRIEQGPAVTLVAGTVFALALVSACLAVRRQAGTAMLVVASVNALIFLNMATSLILNAMRGRGFQWQFGEFLTIPSAVGFVLTLCVLVLPFAASTWWAASRVRNPT